MAYAYYMPIINFLPADVSVNIEPGTTLREAVHMAGLTVQDRCGGFGACCSCSVKVVRGMENLNPKTPAEEVVFYLANDERLSCQCRPTGDLVVLLD